MLRTGREGGRDGAGKERRLRSRLIALRDVEERHRIETGAREEGVAGHADTTRTWTGPVSLLGLAAPLVVSYTSVSTWRICWLAGGARQGR